MMTDRMTMWSVRCLWAAAVVVVGVSSWGCTGGPQCADGTVERNGQCVVKESACADGTVLEDGQCVPGAPPCGDGTRFDTDSGACVPTADDCAPGTTFDQATGQCTPNPSILCGEGTQANAQGVCVLAAGGCATGTVLGDDGRCIPASEACAAGTELSASGQCVPAEDACGPKTRLDSQGRCVVGASACAAGTELDPNSGGCVVVDAACGDGLALDANSMTCVLTDQVCALGTRFDASSGLCLPDACQSGDVLVNGVCMAPAEELAQHPDLTEVENNDPALGGTAQALTLPAVGDPAFVFTGDIEAPRDIDADGYVDQDVDRFTFTATAGTWIKLGVQRLGVATPAFKVEGPNDYERSSGVGAPTSAARQLLLPYDGDYTVSILPQTRSSEADTGPVGGADWGWVASLAQIAAPTAQQLDLSSGSRPITGTLHQLSNNVIEVSGVTAGDRLSLASRAAPVDGQVVLQLWQNPTTFIAEQPVVAQMPSFVAPSNDFIVVLDWKTTTGSRLNYDYEVSTSGERQSRDLSSHDSMSTVVSAQKFDVLEISQHNQYHRGLDLTVTGPDGEVVESTQDFRDGKLSQVPVFKAGDYTVTVATANWAAPGTNLALRRMPPIDLGTPRANALTRVGPVRLDAGQRIFVKVDMAAMHVLEMAPDNQQDADVWVTLRGPQGEVESYDGGGLGGAVKGTDDFRYAYRYFPQDQSVLVVLRATSDTTGNLLELKNIEPRKFGAVSAGHTYAAAASSCAKSRVKWYSLTTTNPAHIELMATSARGGEFSAKLLAANGDALASGQWSNSSHTLFYQPLTPATFIGRFLCTTLLAGLDVHLDVSAPRLQDLGSLSAGAAAQSTPVDIVDEDYQAYQVELTAGDILEIAHDNDGSTHASVDVRGPSGVLDSNYPLVALSRGERGEYKYVYAAATGTYTVQLTTHSAVSNEVLHVRAIAPTPLGTLSTTSPVSGSPAGALDVGQSAFYTLTLASGGDITSTVTTPAGESLAQYIFQGTHRLTRDLSNPATAHTFEQGAVILEVNAHVAIASHSVALSLGNPVASESEPNDTQALADAPGPLPFTVYGHAEGLGQSQSSDYFAVDLATALGSSETLEITALHESQPALTNPMELRLFDTQGNQVAADLDEGSDHLLAISAGGLSAGTYYVGLSPVGDPFVAPAYKLSVSRQ